MSFKETFVPVYGGEGECDEHVRVLTETTKSDKDKSSLQKLKEQKETELEKEHEFYRELRGAPRKSPADWKALKMSENTENKLIKEIEKLKQQITELEK